MPQSSTSAHASTSKLSKSSKPPRQAPLLQWTGNPSADQLVASDPLALLIGFCLDQQIPVEKAFMGPLLMSERLGSLDATALAQLPAATFEAAFRQIPAIHRYPASMARRVQALCAVISEQYDGDAAAVWRGVEEAAALRRRVLALPGFGAMKTNILCAVLANHFGVKPSGWKELLPTANTLANVTTLAERKQYQVEKRAIKAAQRARA